MLIGGELRDARSGRTLDSVDPASEQVIGRVAAADAEDVDDAVRAAREGFAAWRVMMPAQRGKILRELAARMDERAEAFAMTDVLDSGNPINGMRSDAAGASSDFHHFGGLGGEMKGVTLQSPEAVVASSYREPFGVVGRIIPFNHPYRFCAKIAPALAAGNAVILKPSEHTSLSACEFATLTQGLLPDGVVNVLTGLGGTVGAAIAAHPGIPRLAFTGGVESGRAIARAGAEHMKRLSFELGGKNPLIVFPDVDCAAAARASVSGMNLSRSMGQSCQSTSRVFVHDQIYDQFLDHLGRLIAELRIGHPMDEATDIGPLAFERHYLRVVELIESGKAEGARLVVGGGRPTGFERGFYVEPTVFADVEPWMRIAHEEIFGPVISVFRWSDWDEVVRMANNTPFGLAANVWTNDLNVAHRTVKALEVGLVWVNGRGGRVQGAPFGGYKLSGIGKESDLSDLLSYTQEKYVQVHLQ